MLSLRLPQPTQHTGPTQGIPSSFQCDAQPQLNVMTGQVSERVCYLVLHHWEHKQWQAQLNTELKLETGASK